MVEREVLMLFYLEELSFIQAGLHRFPLPG